MATGLPAIQDALLVCASAGVLGASLPDVDLRWSRQSPPPLVGAQCHIWEHRGPTHSLTAALALLVFSAMVIHPVFGIAVGAGYVSHLIADGISYMGVPYLWPLTARRFRLLPYRWRLRSGSVFEVPIAVAVAAMAYVAVVRS